MQSQGILSARVVPRFGTVPVEVYQMGDISFATDTDGVAAHTFIGCLRWGNELTQTMFFYMQIFHFHPSVGVQKLSVGENLQQKPPEGFGVGHLKQKIYYRSLQRALEEGICSRKPTTTEGSGGL